MSKTPENLYKRTIIYTLSDPVTNEIRYIGKEAANFLDLKSNSKIVACARGIRKSCSNFQWSYEKHDNIGEIKPNRQIGKKLNKNQRNMVVKNLKSYGKFFR